MRKILISNDDGIDAKGIRALGKALHGIAEVYVFAPESQRSAAGHSITLRDQITVKEASFKGAEAAYALSGTPADCVKFGLQHLREEGIVPDFVISGINMGGNLGQDVHYSGTVGAAVEGALNGIRSIALSVESHEAEHFEYISRMIPELLSLSEELGPEIVLNVNAPNLPIHKVQGVRMIGSGELSFDDRFEPVELPEAEPSGKSSIDSPFAPAGKSSIDPPSALTGKSSADSPSAPTGKSSADSPFAPAGKSSIDSPSAPTGQSTSGSSAAAAYRYKAGVRVPLRPEADNDVTALRSGYATITPLRTTMDDPVALHKIRRAVSDKTLVVLIDFQEKLLPAMRKEKELLQNVVKFAKCAERLDLPVIVSQQYTRGLGPTVPELRQSLTRYDKIEKITFNCFDTPGFEEKALSAASRSVVLAGIEAHICLLQTARGFLDRGFHVTVLRDCTSSRRKEDYEAAMDLLAREGCTITTWEAYVYQILGSSAHTAFRAISAIVKE